MQATHRQTKGLQLSRASARADGKLVRNTIVNRHLMPCWFQVASCIQIAFHARAKGLNLSGRLDAVFGLVSGGSERCIEGVAATVRLGQHKIRAKTVFANVVSGHRNAVSN